MKTHRKACSKDGYIPTTLFATCGQMPPSNYVNITIKIDNGKSSNKGKKPVTVDRVHRRKYMQILASQ
jgi:hypothetical protein